MPETDPATGSTFVNANGRQLKKLAPSDWIRLGNCLLRTRKNRKREEMAEAGAKEEDIRKELDLIDRRPVKYWDVERFLNDIPGQYEAIRLSLAKDTNGQPVTDEAFATLGLHPSEWLRVAGELADLSIMSETAVDPLSGGPAAEGQEPTQGNPTSPPSPTESAATST